MVQVLVCKNDGGFEFVPAELEDASGGWDDVKMALARALYCEEELFAVDSPDDIALYKLPEGEPDFEDDPIEVHVTAGSKWVLDIFSSPLRRTSDLNLQTDQAIRGMRRGSVLPSRRISTMPSFPSATPAPATPISPLGNTAYNAPPTDASLLSPTNATANATTYQEPYIHIGTWVPMMVKDKSRSGVVTPLSSPSKGPAGAALLSLLKPPPPEYEDVLLTTRRALEYINKFRLTGRPVTVMSIQTCTLPAATASPNAISRQGPRVLYEGVYQLSTSELEQGLIQVVRLWFSFDCEQTVSVTKVNGALGLKPLRQQDGWIVVQALPGSPCFDAGMRRDEVFLTHVNGVDVSPHAFPAVGAVGASFSHAVNWKESVLPLVEKCETCIFTFF